MRLFSALQAQVSVQPVLPEVPHGMTSKGTGLLADDLAMIVALGLVILLGFGAWARFIRPKKSNQPKPKRNDSRAVPEAGRLEDPREASGSRRRRRRRSHRPRNPTLAETGGLPPCRSNTPGDSLPEDP